MAINSKHPILETSGLNLGYGQTTLFSNLNLNFEKGELIAVLGANGIGKSTLLRTLSGLQPALGGDIRVEGELLEQMTLMERARAVSVVLTREMPASGLSGREIAALGRQPHTDWLGRLTPSDQQIVEQALELCDCAKFADRKWRELSDGQRQKIMVSRAIAQHTPLIFLDEPTTHLDLPNKIALFRLLKQLVVKTGRTVVFSTHELSLALKFSDRILALMPGEVACGTLSELTQTGTFDRLFPNSGLRFNTDSFAYEFDGI